MLERLGYEVVGVADSAEAAERLLESERPDVLLIDIVLEGERDGIDLALEVRRRREDIPIIFITSHGDEATVMRAKLVHPKGYLIKPLLRENVFATLEIATAGLVVEREASADIPSAAAEPGLQRNQLRRVRGLVQERYADELNLDRLAAHAGLSKFHFSRRFRRSTGVTPYQYLLSVRIDRAKDLLATGQLAVGAIARQVGFKSASQFSRAFRRVTGKTPVEYRRQI